MTLLTIPTSVLSLAIYCYSIATLRTSAKKDIVECGMSSTDQINALLHLGLVVVPLAVAVEHLGDLVLPTRANNLHVAVPPVSPAPPAAAAVPPAAAPIPLVAGAIDGDHLSPSRSDSLEDYDPMLKHNVVNMEKFKKVRYVNIYTTPVPFTKSILLSVRYKDVPYKTYWAYAKQSSKICSSLSPPRRLRSLSPPPRRSRSRSRFPRSRSRSR